MRFAPFYEIDDAVEKASKEQENKHNQKIANFIVECNQLATELNIDEDAFFFEYILGFSKEEAERMSNENKNAK